MLLLLIFSGEYLAERSLKFWKDKKKKWHVTVSEVPREAEEVVPWPPVINVSIQVLVLLAKLLEVLVLAFDSWQDLSSDAAKMVDNASKEVQKQWEIARRTNPEVQKIEFTIKMWQFLLGGIGRVVGW